MIQVEGLTKFFGPIPAVQDVSFAVEQGRITGFLGPNAAGKSTTMRVLCGYFPATRGTAKIAGFDVHNDPLEVKRRIGYLPENVPLYGEMLVTRFLYYVATIKGVARSERAKEVARVIDRCGLQEMKKRTVRNLSKGFRQRVGLAQALIGNPPVLILDEPTVGLDPRQIIEIRELIRGLAEEHTVLLSTHILPEVAMTCEEVVIINRGRIVTQDKVSNLTGGGANARALYALEVSGPREEVVRLARETPGVTRVSTDAPERYRVEMDNDPAVRTALIQALVQAGHGLRALAPRERTLEDIFIDAIAAEEDAPHP